RFDGDEEGWWSIRRPYGCTRRCARRRRCRRDGGGAVTGWSRCGSKGRLRSQCRRRRPRRSTRRSDRRGVGAGCRWCRRVGRLATRGAGTPTEGIARLTRITDRRRAAITHAGAVARIYCRTGITVVAGDAGRVVLTGGGAAVAVERVAVVALLAG